MKNQMVVFVSCLLSGVLAASILPEKPLKPEAHANDLSVQKVSKFLGDFNKMYDEGVTAVKKGNDKITDDNLIPELKKFIQARLDGARKDLDVQIAKQPETARNNTLNLWKKFSESYLELTTFAVQERTKNSDAWKAFTTAANEVDASTKTSFEKIAELQDKLKSNEVAKTLATNFYDLIEKTKINEKKFTDLKANLPPAIPELPAVPAA